MHKICAGVEPQPHKHTFQFHFSACQVSTQRSPRWAGESEAAPSPNQTLVGGWGGFMILSKETQRRRRRRRSLGHSHSNGRQADQHTGK